MTPPVNELEALLGEVDQLRATVVALKDETLRERADLDNQRKRLARDVDMARKFANERLLSELLPRVRQPGRRPGRGAARTPPPCARAST